MFFERFPTTIPTSPHDLPPRHKIDACMRMWGQLFTKTSQSEWPCIPVDKEICDLLDGVEDPILLELVLYPYVGMDWRGCENIHFTEDEPLDDRGNIIFIFSLN